VSMVVMHGGTAVSRRGTRFGDERGGDPRLHQRAQLDSAICATDRAALRCGARTSDPTARIFRRWRARVSRTRANADAHRRSGTIFGRGTCRAQGLSRIAAHRSPLDRHNVVRVLRRMQVSHAGEGEARKPPVARPGATARSGPFHAVALCAPHDQAAGPTRNRAAAGGQPLPSSHPGELAIALAAICNLGRNWC